MVEVYQAALVIIALFAAYLYWQNAALREKIRALERSAANVPPEVAAFRAANQAPASAAAGSAESASAPEPADQETDDEEQTPKKEYNYVDPDMGKPPIVPAAALIGREESVHGDAVYGTEKGYDRDSYIGRVSHGAELELVDRRVYKNEFEIDIIKVKVLKNEWPDEVGQICWLGMKDTSFRSSFNPKTRMIED